MKKLIIFDLDGTLAESKSSIDKEMGMLLNLLLEVEKVAIISGGDWPQFQKQVISHLKKDAHFNNLFILPTCGTKFYEYKDTWTKRYADDFTDEERSTIIDALHQAIKTSGLSFDQLWGDQIEDRGSQITFSALGQQAPLKAKESWDPTFEKRKKIKTILDSMIPTFSVRLGGTTSIDITRPGIDKSYGIKKLHEVLSIGIEEMIFIGDAIFPGGNDYPAKEAGVASIRVRDPNETKRVIESIIVCMSDKKLPTVGVEKTSS